MESSWQVCGAPFLCLSPSHFPFLFSFNQSVGKTPSLRLTDEPPPCFCDQTHKHNTQHTTHTDTCPAACGPRPEAKQYVHCLGHTLIKHCKSNWRKGQGGERQPQRTRIIERELKVREANTMSEVADGNERKQDR